MTLVEFLVVFLEVFFVVMFAMNLAVVLTWAERRQGALLQDRVGPNRAVIWLPRTLARGLALGPALLVAAAVVGFAYANVDDVPAKTGNTVLFTQGAIFMGWLTALFIAGAVRRRGAQGPLDTFIAEFGDPRRFFYAGLLAHFGTFLVGGVLRGTDTGRSLRDAVYGPSAFLLAAMVVGGALYAVAQMKDERIGLRLAGLLHPAADGLKTAFKEDFIPPGADRLMHSLAPLISFFPVLVVLGVVPFGDTLCFGIGQNEAGEPTGLDLSQLQPMVARDTLCVDGAVPLQAIDLNVGILYFFALAGTGIVGAALAGWASNNKYSLLGGLRAASQMVSYEVTLGLTIIGCVMVFGTLRIDEMVRWQAANAWGIFVQPLAFILFFAAAVAESKRIPFDLPEGESELVAGYYTEYAGMKFSMFFVSEYVTVVTSSSLMAALFLGGWHLPFVYRDGIEVLVGETSLLYLPLSHLAVVLLGFLGFILKVLVLSFVQITIRWTLPRFRYDQLMKLGWRMLLPASLVNILLTGLAVLAAQSAGPAVTRMLALAGNLTQLVVALGVLAAVAVFVRFLLAPAHHAQVLSSTSAQFASLAGGTQSAKLGA